MVEVIALSRQASGLTKGQRQGNLWDARAIEGTSVTGCSLLSHPGADTGSRKDCLTLSSSETTGATQWLDLESCSQVGTSSTRACRWRWALA